MKYYIMKIIVTSVLFAALIPRTHVRKTSEHRAAHTQFLSNIKESPKQNHLFLT